MMKNYLFKFWVMLCVFGLNAIFNLNAQTVNTYGFSSSSGTYTPLVGGTALTGVGPGIDSGSSPLTNIGFTFNYGGNNFTQFSATSNGYIQLGAVGGTTTYTPISTVNNTIAFMARDGRTAASEGVTYALSGVAPNQVLTIQFVQQVHWNNATDIVNAQIKLYETTNVVEIVYGNPPAATSNYTAQVGLRGASAAGFSNRTSTTSWSATTAGAANTNTMTWSPSVLPANGQTYRWSPPPAAPPAPTEVAGTPNCVTGTDIQITGTPSNPDVVWYWQGTNPTGTSTANPVSSNFNVLTNNTYYARAFNTVFNVWSTTSSSIVINSIPVAATPTAPTADMNPSCVTTGSQLSAALTGDPNITYYWQGTNSTGTSTANEAATDLTTTPFTAGSTGTYYISAFDAATSCWSPTSSIAITVQTAVPAAPTASPAVYNICGGLSDFDITAVGGPSSTTMVQNTPMGTNLISTGAGNTFPVTIPALPAGASLVSAQLVLSNVNATNGSYRSEIRVGLSGINTLAPTQISTLNSGGLISPDPAPINLTGFPTTGGTLNLLLTETYDDAGVDDATFGSVNLVITYSLPSDINWYDAASAGSMVGTGSPFDCIGNSVMADPSSNGTYEFYASSVDGVCESSARTLVTVNVLDVNVTLTPIDETCIGYMNGSFEISDTLCGTIPFTVDVDGGGFGPIPTDLGPGTYTVTVRDNNGFDSAPTTVVIGTTDSYIPEAPTVTVDEYFVCSGATTQMIEATVAGSGTANISLATNYSLGAGAIGVFNGNIAIPSGATITSANIIFDQMTTTGGTWFSDIDFNLTGAITNPVTSLIGTTGTNVGPQVFPVTVSSLNGGFTMSMTDTWGSSATTFGSISIEVNYTLPATGVEWYDAATNGNHEGTGSPYEAIGSGTPIITNPATAGVYEFYAGALAGGCYSVDRTLVTVNVNDVNVELTAIDATCNNSATGSFIISNVICGTGPFTVSIDGGTFGAIPTDLMAGTYSVEVMDNTGAISASYTVVIDEADGPSGTYMEDITDNGGQVSWNANGNETEWNVEWGLPGFTPGTGTSIGSTQAMDTFAIITGLDGNTNYDVYVSANCGAGTTTGSWDMVNWTTDCGIYTLPFEETFEDDSETRVCWYNESEVGIGDWTYETGSSGGLVLSAFEGTKNARFVSEFGTNSPITKLASPRFDFTGQDSVALIFAYAQEVWFSDQNTTKVYTTGSSSVWTEIASYTSNVDAWTVDTLYVADTTVQIAFEGINNFGRANVIDHVRFMPCTLNSGIDGSADVCRLDGTFDLNTIVTKGEDFGTWTFAQNPGVLNGSIVSVSTLPAGTYDFHYIVKTPCATDTTFATLTIFPPSSAGVDGTITACRNEPIYLLSGLSGNVDLGGQWYNPANQPTNVSITTSNIPGNYNFDYIVSNGVCPNDTSNILVTVGSCDYLNVQELVFGDMNVYPNPTDGLVFISNASSSETFSYEILDVKGKVLTAKEAAIYGTTTTEVSMEKLEPGVYMIRVYNSEAEKTFRIVKQ